MPGDFVRSQGRQGVIFVRTGREGFFSFCRDGESYRERALLVFVWFWLRLSTVGSGNLDSPVGGKGGCKGFFRRGAVCPSESCEQHNNECIEIPCSRISLQDSFSFKDIFSSVVDFSCPLAVGTSNQPGSEHETRISSFSLGDAKLYQLLLV